MRGSVTVHMDAPPEKVWALVSDVTKIGQFSPETFEAEWLDGASGPAGRRAIPRPRAAQRSRARLLDHLHRARLRAGAGVRLRRRTRHQADQHVALPARAERCRHRRDRVVRAEADARDPDLLEARSAGRGVGRTSGGCGRRSKASRPWSKRATRRRLRPLSRRTSGSAGPWPGCGRRRPPRPQRRAPPPGRDRRRSARSCRSRRLHRRRRRRGARRGRRR